MQHAAHPPDAAGARKVLAWLQKSGPSRTSAAPPSAESGSSRQHANNTAPPHAAVAPQPHARAARLWSRWKAAVTRQPEPAAPTSPRLSPAVVLRRHHELLPAADGACIVHASLPPAPPASISRAGSTSQQDAQVAAAYSSSFYKPAASVATAADMRHEAAGCVAAVGVHSLAPEGSGRSSSITAGPATPSAAPPLQIPPADSPLLAPRTAGGTSPPAAAAPGGQLAGTALGAYPAVAAALAAAAAAAQEPAEHRPAHAPPLALPGTAQWPGAVGDDSAGGWLLRAALLEDLLQGRAMEVQEALAKLAEKQEQLQALLSSLQGCVGTAGLSRQVLAVRQQLQQELAAAATSASTLSARAAALGGGLASLQATQAVLASSKRRVLCAASRQAVAQLVIADVLARLPGEELQQLPLLAGLPALDAAGDEVCRIAGAGQRPLAPAATQQRSRAGVPACTYTAGPGAHRGGSAAAGSSSSSSRPPLPRSAACDDDDDDDSVVVDSISAALSAVHYTLRPSLAYDDRRRSAAPGAAPGAAVLRHAGPSSGEPVPAAATGPCLAAGMPWAAASIVQAAVATPSRRWDGPAAADAGVSDTDSLVTALSTLNDDDEEEEPAAGAPGAGSELVLPLLATGATSELRPTATAGAGIGDAPIDALLPAGTSLEMLTVGQLLQLLTQAAADARQATQQQ